MHEVNRDTVEEFWDQEVLSMCAGQARKTTTAQFVGCIRDFIGASGEVYAVRSGRYALERLLVCAAEPGRRSVLICGFNCYVVADAVFKAGFNIETYDFSSETGRFDWQAIADMLNERHVAIVIPHFLGYRQIFVI